MHDECSLQTVKETLIAKRDLENSDLDSLEQWRDDAGNFTQPDLPELEQEYAKGTKSQIFYLSGCQPGLYQMTIGSTTLGLGPPRHIPRPGPRKSTRRLAENRGSRTARWTNPPLRPRGRGLLHLLRFLPTGSTWRHSGKIMIWRPPIPQGKE